MSEGRRVRPNYEGDPTMLRVMVRPQWIAALLLALLVAAGFAWLGRWQLGNAIRIQPDETTQSETVRQIADVAQPAGPVTDTAAGMTVELTGRFVPGDFLVVDDRTNGGTQGAWVTGHVVVTDPGDAGSEASGSGDAESGEAAPAGASGAHLSVAVGWAASRAEAEQTLAGLSKNPALNGEEVAIQGRYMPSDATELPEPQQDPSILQTMAPAQLINRWQPFEGPAYAGYLVLHPVAPLDATALANFGLAVIDSVPPLPAETVNWLNVFYAVEWVLFAGFAVFFWFRLTRDAWEKEHELKELVEAENLASSGE